MVTKREKPRGHRTIEEYETALRKAQGFVTAAAEILGLTHGAVSMRIKNSKRLQKVQRESREFVLDVAESKLFAALEKEKSWAVMYFLNNQGKARGYGRKWWEDDGTPGDGNATVKWSDPGPPKKADIDDLDACVDLEALGELPRGIKREHLGLSGKGANGKDQRVNGEDDETN